MQSCGQVVILKTYTHALNKRQVHDAISTAVKYLTTKVMAQLTVPLTASLVVYTTEPLKELYHVRNAWTQLFYVYICK